MKAHTLLIAALGFASPALVSAGEAEATNTTTYQAPAAPSQHQGWYFGAGIDYMVDAEEAFYNAHLGYDFGNGSSLFLESGWLGEEDDSALLFPFSTEVDIIPVTFNYKYEHMFTDSFGLYVGAGLGASYTDISAGPLNDEEWVFTAQVFAGLVYNVSPGFEIYAGARYLWMDEVSLVGANVDDLDDVGIGAGIRFNF